VGQDPTPVTGALHSRGGDFIMKLSLVSLLIALILGVLLGALMGFSSHKQASCIHIFYDEAEGGGALKAKRFVSQLKILLKSFPQYEQIISSVNAYQKGEINQCMATIYIGSAVDNHLPKSFKEDFIEAKNNVAWLGYNIWQLGSQLEGLFGYRFVRVTSDDFHLKDAKGDPTFFREIHYKGKTYTKYGELDANKNNPFLAPFSQVELVQSDFDKSEVLAEVKHSGTREMIPYILKSRNHYYVADVPLAYVYESDRYKIFADLMVDILKLPVNQVRPLVETKRPSFGWNELVASLFRPYGE
jgi:uncharacterized protein YdaL